MFVVTGFSLACRLKTGENSFYPSEDDQCGPFFLIVLVLLLSIVLYFYDCYHSETYKELTNNVTSYDNIDTYV